MVHIIYIQIVQSALVITKCKSSAHNLKLNVTVTVLTKEEYPKYYFFFSSRRRHTRYWRDWSSDVCSSDLRQLGVRPGSGRQGDLSGRARRAQDPARDQRLPDGRSEAAPQGLRRAEGRRLDHVCVVDLLRSEERRVGKECRSGWCAYR